MEGRRNEFLKDSVFFSEIISPKTFIYFLNTFLKWKMENNAKTLVSTFGDTDR